MNRFHLLMGMCVMAIGCGAQGFAADWPRWGGPNSSHAVDTGIELIDDINTARQVWKSEAVIPHSCPQIKKKTIQFWSGGYCTPIVAQGRVYVAYWRPAGRKDWRLTEEDQKHLAGSRNPTAGRKGKAATAADDIVLCVDAKTGKTLWERVYAGRGMVAGGYKQGTHPALCWYDGVVYATGTSGFLYAMDATSGKPLWEGRLGMAGTIEKARDTANQIPGNRPIMTDVPMAIDGVVAVGNGPLTAFDAKTGALVWPEPGRKDPRRIRKRGGGAIVPKTWEHEGEGYFYAGGRLFHAKTGRLCWDIGSDEAITSVAAKDGVIADDILVTKVTPASATVELCLAAFRLAPDGFELI